MKKNVAIHNPRLGKVWLQEVEESEIETYIKKNSHLWGKAYGWVPADTVDNEMFERVVEHKETIKNGRLVREVFLRAEFTWSIIEKTQ